MHPWLHVPLVPQVPVIHFRVHASIALLTSSPPKLSPAEGLSSAKLHILKILLFEPHLPLLPALPVSFSISISVLYSCISHVKSKLLAMFSLLLSLIWTLLDASDTGINSHVFVVTVVFGLFCLQNHHEIVLLYLQKQQQKIPFCSTKPWSVHAVSS